MEYQPGKAAGFFRGTAWPVGLLTAQVILTAASIAGLVKTVRSEGKDYLWLVYAASGLLVLVGVQFWELHRRQRLLHRPEERGPVPVRPEHRDWLKQRVGGLAPFIRTGLDPAQVGRAERDALKHHFPETFTIFEAWEAAWQAWDPLHRNVRDSLRMAGAQFPTAGLRTEVEGVSDALGHYMNFAALLDQRGEARVVRTRIEREPKPIVGQPGSYLYLEDNLKIRLFPIDADLDELEARFQSWLRQFESSPELRDLRMRGKTLANSRQVLVGMLETIQSLQEVSIRSTRCDHC